jgi:LEA14-like dessication related protein
MSIKPITLFAAAAAAWVLFKGAGTARAVSNLTTQLTGAKLWKFSSLTQAEARVKLRFINPTSAPVSFSGVVLNVFYKTSQIGTVVQNTPVTVQPAGFTEVVFPFFIDLLPLGFAVISQLRSGGKLGAIRFTGFIQAVGLDIPVDQTIDLGGMKL